MLAIRCEFLQGTYQASPPGRPEIAEWPPHPARLHAALVAAGWALDGGGSFPSRYREALTGLEEAGAPVLSVPAAGERTPMPTFVPRNLTPREMGTVRTAIRRGGATNALLGRVGRHFPVAVPGEQPVWFQWQIDPPDRAALEELVAAVQYLGSSRSPVCCDLSTEEAPDASLVPAAVGGSHALRVARRGDTDRLLAARLEYPPPPSGVPQGYWAPHSGPVQSGVVAGPFASVEILAFAERCPLAARDTLAVTEALRAAVLAHAGDDAPGVLHGHTDRSAAPPCDDEYGDADAAHVAFLAFPAVGHRHADTGLRGVGVALPAGLSHGDAVQIIRAVRAVGSLHVPGRGTFTLTAPAGLRSTEPERWIAPARRWRTVTPVVLDRHPRSRTNAALDAAIRQTLRYARIPAPASIEVSTVAFVPAAPHAGEMRGDRLGGGLRVHLDMRYDRPVRGPLMAGRLRHFGVGMLLPDPGDRA